ncbi:LAME_0A06744g1_1 [Lachancea meyersii CBS 8951]|uniref:LAME_0A06744g1_1 n=1 Tax=Lachancea meyersii CBS 8951 TaxID=1266667 RepID=A0A1G4IQK8_9SACH|nr:LAME_0A06744g1_1 [Lachancea meyersii CBS 8951]
MNLIWIFFTYMKFYKLISSHRYSSHHNSRQFIEVESRSTSINTMRNEKHGIRIPGPLLDELKEQNYGDDARFNGGKRKRKTQLGRKERRKQQRQDKRNKVAGGARTGETVENGSKSVKNGPKSGKLPKLAKATNRESPETGKIAEISGKPGKKSSGKKPAAEELSDAEKLPFSSDDELSSGDFEEFGSEDLDAEEWEQLNELEQENGHSSEQSGQDYSEEEEEEVDEEEDDEDGEQDTEMSVEETMLALKRVKQKKSAGRQEAAEMTPEETMRALKKAKETAKSRTVEDSQDSDSEPEMSVAETMEALKRAKENKKNSKQGQPQLKTTASPKKAHVAPPSLTPSQLAQAEKDKWDHDYYAKKLGLKGKQKNLKASNEFDAIGGLLEGLDFFENYDSEDSQSGEAEEEAQSEVSEEDQRNGRESESQSEAGENPFSSDDEISEGDFDEFDENDLDEQEWKDLHELEGQGSDQNSDQETSSKRENPYVAPAAEPVAYVPPSLRRKNLGDDKSQSVIELRKKVKSSLNKLSGSNITVIVSSLSEIYDSYPRQHVNDALADQTLEIVCHRDKLLDSFIINYAAVVFSLWKLRGTEVGASFLQKWVERLLETFHRDEKTLTQQGKEDDQDSAFVMSKECNNLIAFLSYCYNFGLVSSRLIYDVIEMLIKTPNEFTTELLLRIISISGQLIRGDDPKGLKVIISELLTNVKNIKQSPRMKFLLEVMTDLKNNRLKPSLLATSHSGVKKSISNFISGTVSSSSDPLQVTLDDIENIETKGKWWLVGASWKGNLESAFEDKKSRENGTRLSKSTLVVNDDMLDDIPNWGEIARSQRMNTEVRRALFVSVMSAQDFMDAFARIDKLNLKNKQSLEIPRVLLHCLAMEGIKGSYNPFYSLLGVKLSQHHHHVAKAFQFMFWDMVKKFEREDDSDVENALDDEDDLDEDKKLKKISCQGRFFGLLLAEEVLKLDIFKHVPLMGGLSGEGALFVEIMIFQFLLSIAKKCEVKKNSGGVRTISYESAAFERLIEHSSTFENSASVYAALNVFLKKRFKYQAFVTEQEGTRDYERQIRRLEWAFPQFLELIKTGLKGQGY